MATVLEEAGEQKRLHYERAIREELRAAARARGNVASVFAGLVGGKSCDAVIEKARQRFRAVSWEDLEFRIFAEGGLSNNRGKVELRICISLARQ